MSKAHQDKIQQMVKFIEKEAEDKVREIEQQAQEEFVIEKTNLVETARKNVKASYKKKEQQVEVQKKIDQSNRVKVARMEILKMKEQILKDMLKESLARLRKITENKQTYKKLLHDLIMQALITLRESKVSVNCRDADKELIQSVIPDILKEYKSKTGLETTITIGDKLAAESAGGVIVFGIGDRIKVSNTLEDRLQLAFDQTIPSIRNSLFPKSSQL